MNKLFKAAALALGAALISTTAVAGPIIIAGTDADDHGFVSGGVNQTGWLFMQRAFENLGSQVTNGNKIAVCIGCNSGQAANAFNSAVGLSSLNGAGWTFTTLTTSTDITNFFNGTGTTNINNVGIYYMPTDTGNVGGGINATQLGIVNANAALLNTFVAGGGGFFSQDEQFTIGGFGWLTTLLPGLIQNPCAVGCNSGVLNIAGTNPLGLPADPFMNNATPWHSYFTGNFGGLGVLVTGPVSNVAEAVVIGGGAGTVFQCGQQGQPPCPTPEPDGLALLGVGLAAAFAVRRRKTT